jgi:hypothetical protein
MVASLSFIGIALFIVYLGGEKIDSTRVLQQLGGEHAKLLKRTIFLIEAPALSVARRIDS